ncbi:MAG: ABC transporter substrate-binding protein [Proteobacteria bacterium]|nr:ABC transporter substrate-binding protein [Pseudomonadota bacterium]
MKSMVLFLSVISGILSAEAVAADRHTVVVVEQSHGKVAFYDSLAWRRLGEVRVGKNPHEIALTADDRTAYVTNFGIQDYDETIGVPGSTVSEIDICSMVETRQFSTKPDLAPHGVKVRPAHDRELFVNTEKPARMVVIDLKTGAVKRRFDVDSKTHNFVFSTDGSILWLMAGLSGVLAVDPESGRVIARHSLNSPARGLALSADQKVLVASGKDEIELLDPVTLLVQKRFSGFGVGQILYAEPSPDGRYIVAPAVWDSTVLVIDMQLGTVLRRFVSGLDPVAVAFSPDGTAAYISNARDQGLTKIELATLRAQRVGTMEGPNGLATSSLMPNSGPRKRAIFGAVLPLSGRDAPFGREMMLGYELWKNDLNARGGLYIDGQSYVVETAYLDTASNSTQTESLARQAVTQGAQFLLGSYGTPDNGAVAKVAAHAQLPMVTSAGAARSLYLQGNRFLFGIMAPASEYLVGSIDVALTQTPMPTSAAVLTSDAPAPLEDARNASLYGRAHGLSTVTLPALRGPSCMRKDMGTLPRSLRLWRSQMLICL